MRRQGLTKCLVSRRLRRLAPSALAASLETFAVVEDRGERKGVKMQFAIVNHATDPALTPALLQQIAAAVERQTYEHVAPFWEMQGAKVTFYSDVATVPADAVIVAIFDSSEQSGFLGWHAVDPRGLAYARVFWEPIRDSGGTIFASANSLSVTISHEVLETMGDVYTNFWAANPWTQDLYALELCDAVEADAYVIDGVYVSNFIGPRFFRQGPGPYDWMNLVKDPYETRPASYQIVADAVGNIHQIYGEGYPEWKKALREHPAARKERRRKSHVAHPRHAESK